MDHGHYFRNKILGQSSDNIRTNAYLKIVLRQCRFSASLNINFK